MANETMLAKLDRKRDILLDALVQHYDDMQAAKKDNASALVDAELEEIAYVTGQLAAIHKHKKEHYA